MKRVNDYLKLIMVALLVTMVVTSCEDEAISPPLAFFTAEADADNTQLIAFTNETENGVSYVWDFGDGKTSTEMSPSNEYAEAGLYTVKLTATNEGGNNTYTEDITVVAKAPENLIVNGTFDTDSDWTIVNHYKSDNTDGSITIADGVAAFTRVESDGWVHMGLYQAVTLEVGTYAIDLDIDIAGIDQCWGEVYVGSTMPVSGTADADADYTDNGIMVAFNAWDCGADAYSGSAVEYGCTNDAFPKTDGIFEISEAGTYYVHFKSGGASWGPNGVKIDNITLFKQP